MCLCKNHVTRRLCHDSIVLENFHTSLLSGLGCDEQKGHQAGCACENRSG